MHDYARCGAGHTLLELVIVVTIVGIILSIAVPRARLILDRQSVHAAASDVTSILQSARTLALTSHSSVAVDLDSTSGVVRIRRGTDRLLVRNIAQAHGVRLGNTRDSLTYDAHGLGRGAANLSVIIRRGAAVETVFVSRFGRVR